MYKGYLRHVVLASALALVAVSATGSAQAIPDLGQHVAVPAYFSPSDKTSWNAINGSTSQLGVIVANVDSGPSIAVDSGWKTIIDAAHARGVKVLGYVDSGYFGGSTPARTTALGYSDPTSWMVQAQQQVNLWYQFYGASIDGIFFDDGMGDCGTTSAANLYADLYKNLSDYVHTYHPGSLTIVNPGSPVPQCFENSADVLVTFEDSAANYLKSTSGMQPQAWQLSADPNKFWNIVYSTSASQLSKVLNQSKLYNAGYVYVTPSGAANPYNRMPNASYWSSEQSATVASNTAVPPKPATPVSMTPYPTGAVMYWTSATYSQAVGYEIYQNGVHVASVGNFTPQNTEYSAVGLTPATSYAYTIRARSLAGVLSKPSGSLNFTTDFSWGTAPTAPGALTASAVGGTGVRLSWRPSVGSNDAVAFYDVYQNGSRLLTLTADINSINLGLLSPGTNYSFYVIARVNSNTASMPSNTVNVVTAKSP